MPDTPEKIALDRLTAQINARLADGVQEEAIGDRRVAYTSLSELIAQQKHLQIVVAKQSSVTRPRRNIKGVFCRG